MNLSLLFSYTYVCCWSVAIKSFDLGFLSNQVSLVGRRFFFSFFLSFCIYLGTCRQVFYICFGLMADMFFLYVYGIK